MKMTLQEVYENRRAVNSFDVKRSLSEEVLKEIIDLGVYAPSAFNLQPWRLIAVQSEAQKEKLHGLANKQPKVMEAPVTLILVGNTHGYADANPVWSELEAMVGKEGTDGAKGMAGFLYGSDEKRQLKFAESNAGLLAMSIMYAASSLGVDSHPMSGVDFDGVKAGFELKAEEEVVMLISLGYRDESKQLYPRRARLGFDNIVTVV